MIAFALLTVLLGGPDRPVTGRVVKINGADTVGVAGARVILHRVTASKQGPIDSLLSGADGAFRFAVRPDSGVIYLVSSRWAGIEYFGPPIATRGDAVPTIVTVADTSATAPITLAARHLVVSAPSADGSRGVLDLLILENRGTHTRVARDSNAATWTVPLPPGALGAQLGESDFSNDAVTFADGTMRLHAALPPGQRQLYLEYRIPAGTSRQRIPFDGAAGTVNLLTEERGARVEGGLAAVDSQTVNGKTFSRWTGAVAAGTVLTLRLAATGTPSWLLPSLVGGIGALLLLATVTTLRRRRTVSAIAVTMPAAAAAGDPTLRALVERLAALDAAHRGGPEAHDAAAWADYLAERARLKAEAARYLPPGG